SGKVNSDRYQQYACKSLQSFWRLLRARPHSSIFSSGALPSDAAAGSGGARNGFGIGPEPSRGTSQVAALRSQRTTLERAGASLAKVSFAVHRRTCCPVDRGCLHLRGAMAL